MKAFEDSYRATTYQAVTERGKVEIRIGHIDKCLDLLLTSRSFQTWAFITAWNPESKILGIEENKARNELLLKQIQAHHWISYPGSGIPADPTWQPEESFLILGISMADARRLGAEFRQNAIVFGVFGTPAALIWCL